MSARVGPLSVDPGLLTRFRAAGKKIVWRTVGGKRPSARIAHLNDEEARVELSGRGVKSRVTVDSGPLGALVLLLEIDRRGPPTGLGASEAGRAARFPSGAIVAAWDGESVPEDSKPGVDDLVDLARYSLA